jgi:hypothetical protein
MSFVAPMDGENQLLLTDESVEVQDFWKSTNHFRGIYGIYLKLIKKKSKVHNMQPVGLGNTSSIFTAYHAQKSPRTLC